MVISKQESIFLEWYNNAPGYLQAAVAEFLTPARENETLEKAAQRMARVIRDAGHTKEAERALNIVLQRGLA